MTKYKVDIAGIDTNKIKVLKNKEMIELFKKFNEGDENAKEELINGNLKLVLSILQRFNRSNINSDDLFQVGVIGLIKAIDNFDISYGLQLSTYAVPLIIGEMKRYIRDNTSLRVSRSIKDLAYQIIKYTDEYMAINGINPSTYEIASSLGIEEFQVGYALDSLKDPKSLYEPIYNDGGDTIYLQDKIADIKDNELLKESIISMKKALNEIKGREKDVLVNRYIIGMTQSEIAKALDISQAQVSRIEKSAIKNVRKLIN